MSIEASNPFETVSSYAMAPSEERTIAGEELWLPSVSGSAGMLVNERTALTLPAVLSLVNVLATDAAMFPLRVYRRSADGGRESVPLHPVDELLNVSPDGETIPLVWKQSLMAHALLWGNGHAEIQRKGIKPFALHLLAPETTDATRIEGQLRYKVSGGKTLVPENVLHVRGVGYDGVNGYNFIRTLRESIGVGLAQQSYTADFYQNGSDPGGWVEVPQKLGRESQERLRKTWEEKHGGPGNRHRIGVLEQGASYKQNAIDPEKAQLLESRKFQVLELARAWRLPPHKVGDYTQAHLANLETSNLDYLMTALMPWLTIIEQEFTFKLFSREERRSGYYVEHNVAALLRGDILSRYNAYHTALTDGWMNRDEVRARENLCPIGEEGGGEKYLVQVNQTTLEKIGEDETLETPAEAAFEESTGEEADQDDTGAGGEPVEESPPPGDATTTQADGESGP
jgi:HK97 family phage portal protein